MILKPVEWNTVVVGSWNPAILTPQGIADILFKKPADVPVEIMVPLDGIGPPRVGIDEQIVTVELGRLVVESKKPEWSGLEQSRRIVLNAIEGLPRTPLSAAGFNVRYCLEGVAAELIELFETKFDALLSDAMIKILGREMRRSLEFNNGIINVHITGFDSTKYNVLMNFEKQSKATKDLVDWLNTGIESVKDIVRKILQDVLKISKEEIPE
ncbi:MAG: hypothetical protein ABR911_01605 [Syntrophales bacterium]